MGRIELLELRLKNNLIKDFGDSDKTETVDLRRDNLAARVISMLRTKPYCYEPEKTYCVAIVYALLIEEKFGVSFFESLNDKCLLLHNGRKFYKTYTEDREIYDIIFKVLPFKDILTIGSETIGVIKDYFVRELDV